jgi:uncharacterized protein (DUF2384 family)
MNADDKPQTASLDALRARFEQQSRKAQVYYAVMHAVRGVLGNDEAANAWMNAPLPALDGRTPADAVAAGHEQDVLAQVRALKG